MFCICLSFFSFPTCVSFDQSHSSQVSLQKKQPPKWRTWLLFVSKFLHLPKLSGLRFAGFGGEMKLICWATLSYACFCHAQKPRTFQSLQVACVRQSYGQSSAQHKTRNTGVSRAVLCNSRKIAKLKLSSSCAWELEIRRISRRGHWKKA